MLGVDWSKVRVIERATGDPWKKSYKLVECGEFEKRRIALFDSLGEDAGDVLKSLVGMAQKVGTSPECQCHTCAHFTPRE